MKRRTASPFDDLRGGEVCLLRSLPCSSSTLSFSLYVRCGFPQDARSHAEVERPASEREKRADEISTSVTRRFVVFPPTPPPRKASICFFMEEARVKLSIRLKYRKAALRLLRERLVQEEEGSSKTSVLFLVGSRQASCLSLALSLCLVSSCVRFLSTAERGYRLPVYSNTREMPLFSVSRFAGSYTEKERADQPCKSGKLIVFCRLFVAFFPISMCFQPAKWLPIPYGQPIPLCIYLLVTSVAPSSLSRGRSVICIDTAVPSQFRVLCLHATACSQSGHREDCSMERQLDACGSSPCRHLRNATCKTSPVVLSYIKRYLTLSHFPVSSRLLDVIEEPVYRRGLYTYVHTYGWMSCSIFVPVRCSC